MNRESQQHAAESKQSLLGIVAATAGMPYIAINLFVGAALSQQLSFRDSLIAIVLGCLIGGLYAGLLGVIGARTGRTTSSLLLDCFGQRGASWMSLLIVCTCICWFAVQSAYFGKAVYGLLPTGGVLTLPYLL
ncbi:MAG: cytosine permease [Bdellovibrionales bacterium]|nr:cytosine permease [Bdellovibrionales bacterium]